LSLRTSANFCFTLFFRGFNMIRIFLLHTQFLDKVSFLFPLASPILISFWERAREFPDGVCTGCALQIACCRHPCRPEAICCRSPSGCKARPRMGYAPKSLLRTNNILLKSTIYSHAVRAHNSFCIMKHKAAIISAFLYSISIFSR